MTVACYLQGWAGFSVASHFWLGLEVLGLYELPAGCCHQNSRFWKIKGTTIKHEISWTHKPSKSWMAGMSLAIQYNILFTEFSKIAIKFSNESTFIINLLPLKNLAPSPAPPPTLTRKTVKMREDGVSNLQLAPQLVFQGFLYFPLISVCFFFTFNSKITWKIETWTILTALEK